MLKPTHIATLAILFLLQTTATAQHAKDSGYWDSENPVSAATFDSLVDFSINVLRHQPFDTIADSTHIVIIRCINSLHFSGTYEFGRYKILRQLVGKTNYQRKMPKKYSWILSRGFGYYFTKLEIELLGTPHLYSKYQVGD